MLSGPNFPEGLNIAPSVAQPEFGKKSFEDDTIFGAAAQEQAIAKFGIAGRVWEAAYLMSSYVSPPTEWTFDPPFREVDEPIVVVELGAGAGIVGHHLLRASSNIRDIVVLTDLPEVCPLLKDNLAKTTSKGHLFVQPLPWGDGPAVLKILPILSGHPITHILCSDLVYFPELLAPLLRTLLLLSAPPFSAPESSLKVVISYRVRSMTKEGPFWSAFGLWFDFHPVLIRKANDSESSWSRFGSSMEDPTYMFVAWRKPGSFSWQVPPEDRDLLSGRGTCGTDRPKSDGTFEALQLMDLDFNDG